MNTPTLPRGVARLDHLGVIRAHGPEAAKFLQGQLTQDFVLLSTTEAKRDVQSIAAKATKETAEVATDVTITAKVKTALAVDSQLSALDINVDTVKGVVSLWGRAPSEEAVKRATTLTKGVEGVTEVKNQLTVVAKN